MNSVVLSNGLSPPVVSRSRFLWFSSLSAGLSVVDPINSYFSITYSNLCFLERSSAALCSGFLFWSTVRTTRLTILSIFQFGIVIFYFQFLNQLVSYYLGHQ
jgi:hypothetical protein